MKRRVIKPSEIVKVFDELKQSLVKSDDGHTWKYVNEHTDETIGAKVGITKHQVARVRRDMFGQLEATGTTASFVARLIGIERRLDVIEQGLGIGKTAQ